MNESEAVPRGHQNRAHLTWLAYDAGGRVTQITHPDGQTGYGYHPVTGQLSEIATRDQPLSYAYDGFLPKSETWSAVGWVKRSVTHRMMTKRHAEKLQLAMLE